VNGHPSPPIRKLFTQIVQEAKPSHFFCIGTAGGTYTNRPLGTIVMSRATQFLCDRTFKNEPFANQARRHLRARQRGVQIARATTRRGSADRT
jgi:hypothetical protein